MHEPIVWASDLDAGNPAAWPGLMVATVPWFQRCSYGQFGAYDPYGVYGPYNAYRPGYGVNVVPGYLPADPRLVVPPVIVAPVQCLGRCWCLVM